MVSVLGGSQTGMPGKRTDIKLRQDRTCGLAVFIIAAGRKILCKRRPEWFPDLHGQPAFDTGCVDRPSPSNYYLFTLISSLNKSIQKYNNLISRKFYTQAYTDNG